MIANAIFYEILTIRERKKCCFFTYSTFSSSSSGANSFVGSWVKQWKTWKFVQCERGENDAKKEKNSLGEKSGTGKKGSSNLVQITLFHNNSGVGGGFLWGNCFVALRGDSDT